LLSIPVTVGFGPQVVHGLTPDQFKALPDQKVILGFPGLPAIPGLRGLLELREFREFREMPAQPGLREVKEVRAHPALRQWPQLQLLSPYPRLAER
jgi:hypothetical protein